MRKKLIFFLAIFIIGFVCYKYIYQKHRNISTEKPEFVITSTDIATQFSKNISESEKKYLNKTIEVSGTISEINSRDLTLNNAVFCQFSDPINSSKEIRSEIKIKGRVIGYDDLLEQVKLDQCTISN